MGEPAEDKGQTFWEHLDELRTVIVRIAVCLLVLSLICFFLKEWLFAIVLAPAHSDFILYEMLGAIAPNGVEDFSSQLINTELTGQFFIHLQVAFCAAAVIGAPFVLWQVFEYLAPALYAKERRVVSTSLLCGSLLFFVGVLVSYFLIFPLSFRFLVLYQVADEVSNMIQLSSYIDTMLMLCLMMGILFEIPLVAILLGKAGFINAKMMSEYRRHAILAILIVSAIITPTTDAFTLFVVALPIYLLYELSITAVRLTGKHNKNQ